MKGFMVYGIVLKFDGERTTLRCFWWLLRPLNIAFHFFSPDMAWMQPIVLNLISLTDEMFH